MSFAQTKTWSEIMAQPAIWRAWGTTFESQRGEIVAWILNQEFDEIWLSGAGTSAFIGDLIATALDGKTSRSIRSVPSTDLVAKPSLLRGRRPLVVSFGRSGNSAETLGVLDALDALAPDAPRLNITCNADSALATRPGRNGRSVLLPAATHDAGFAMTSSFSTMALTAFSLLDQDTEALTDRFASLAQRAQSLLEDLAGLAAIAPVPKRTVFTGAGALQYIARESALKVLELTGGEVAALWDTNLGFRHGPKSFVIDGTDLIVFRSGDPYTSRYDDDLIVELRSQFPGARLTTIGPGCDIDTGNADDPWACVLYVLFAQVQATVWSTKLRYNADDPFEGRGTLTRVVSGVNLYDPSEA